MARTKHVGLTAAFSLLAFALAIAPALAQTTPALTSAARSWADRVAEIEQYLKSAEVVGVEEIGVGVTKPRRATLAPGGPCDKFAWKPIIPGRYSGYWESYKSEIAAYKVDRLLELDMVPPTVEREVDHAKMSAQLWVDGLQSITKVQGQKPPDVDAYNRQVYRHRVFDDLVGNIDENAGNILIDRAWNIVLVDHSRCFAEFSKLPFPLSRIDRQLYGRLKALDAATLNEAIGHLVESGVIRHMLKRRDEIVTIFEKLAAEKGDAQVFIS